MMTSGTPETLYGLDRPDEQTDLKLDMDENKISVIKGMYKPWFERTNRERGWSMEFGKEDFFYEEACKLLSPFKDKITGELHTDELSFSRKNDPYLSFYIAAVLNATDLKKLTVGKKVGQYRLEDPAYRLREGKAVEVLEDAFVRRVAWGAEGGTVINRNGGLHSLGNGSTGGKFINYGEPGTVLDMGNGSKNSLFVNYGKADHMGSWGSQSIYINNGYLSLDMGDDAISGIYLNTGKISRHIGGFGPTGGTFLNCGQVGLVASEAKGGMFVSTTEPTYRHHKYFSEAKPRAYGATAKQVWKDAKLSQMMDDVEKAGKKVNVPEIKKLANCIRRHVRKHYRPRKIA